MLYEVITEIAKRLGLLVFHYALVKYGQDVMTRQQIGLIDPVAPEYGDAFFLQIRILREQDRLDEAQALLEQQISSGPMRNSELYIMLAALHQLEGRDDLSKKVLLQGIEAFPNDVDLLYEYGSYNFV